MHTIREFFKMTNLPNVLTMARLFLVPVYLVFFVVGWKFAALATFIIASITDLLDGMIARKYHLITDFGKMMDPLADKVMIITAILSLAIGNGRNIQPVIPWVVVSIIFIKELIMILGGIALYRHGFVSYSRMIGKVAHVALIVGLIFSFFHPWFMIHCLGWFLSPDLLILWFAVVLTILALFFYMIDGVREARKLGVFLLPKAEKHKGEQPTK